MSSEKGLVPKPSTAEVLVSQGMSIVKIENDTLVAAALQRPRDEAMVLKECLKQLDLSPMAAKKAYYSIPYKDRKKKKTVFVQGLGIDAASTIARLFRNNSNGWRIVSEDDKGFDVEGYFIDMETAVRVTKPYRVSKFIKLRDGRSFRMDEKNMLMALQAGGSKAQRNAILAGLPTYLKDEYFTKARALNSGDPHKPADEKTVTSILRAFARFKVTDEMLESYLGRPHKEWVGEDVADLRGMWTALDDGTISVEDMFSDKDADTLDAVAEVGGEALAKALAGKVEGTDDAPRPNHCEQHPDVELKDGDCWKCVAEAQEKLESKRREFGGEKPRSRRR